MEKISINEAYLSMYRFLENYYKRGQSDEIAIMLGRMSLLEDGTTADPAVFNDWLQAIEDTTNGKVDAHLRLKK
jgi:hypothetical protein